MLTSVDLSETHVQTEIGHRSFKPHEEKVKWSEKLHAWVTQTEVLSLVVYTEREVKHVSLAVISYRDVQQHENIL